MEIKLKDNQIVFVSLGPGDPELITLKGLHALQSADIILAPSTTTKEGATISFALNIIKKLEVDCSKIELFNVPMRRDREQTLISYSNVAKRAVELQSKGLSVAITAEGDGGFYSSSQYIEEAIAELGSSSRRIAGVPAFIECATRSAINLVNLDNSFKVIAKVDSCQMLLSEIESVGNIVLMKISQWEESIKAAITNAPSNYIFNYIENCGVKDKEFITSDREQILNRKFPYFAILIIKK